MWLGLLSPNCQTSLLICSCIEKRPICFGSWCLAIFRTREGYIAPSCLLSRLGGKDESCRVGCLLDWSDQILRRLGRNFSQLLWLAICQSRYGSLRISSIRSHQLGSLALYYSLFLLIPCICVDQLQILQHTLHRNSPNENSEPIERVQDQPKHEYRIKVPFGLPSIFVRQ